jgi:hypothetical protein
MRWGVYVFLLAAGIYVIWNIGTKSHFSDAGARAPRLGRQN